MRVSKSETSLLGLILIIAGCGDPDQGTREVPAAPTNYVVPPTDAAFVALGGTILQLRPEADRVRIASLGGGTITAVGSIPVGGEVVTVSGSADGADLVAGVTVCDGIRAANDDAPSCSGRQHVEVWRGRPRAMRRVADTSGRADQPASERLVSGPFVQGGRQIIEIGDDRTGASDLLEIDGASIRTLTARFNLQGAPRSTVCATERAVWRVSYTADLERFVETNLSVETLAAGSWKAVAIDVPPETFAIDLRCDRRDAYVLLSRRMGGDLVRLTEAPPPGVEQIPLDAGALAFSSPSGPVTAGPVILSRVDDRGSVSAMRVSGDRVDALSGAGVGSLRFAVDLGSRVAIGAIVNGQLQISTW